MVDPKSETEANPGSVTGVAHLVAAAPVASGVGRVRTNFSVMHLLAAARLAREVSATEVANAGAVFGGFFEIILGSGVGCVVLATAAVEAYGNELFADRRKHFTAHDQSVLDLIWEQYEQKPVIDKFDLAYRLRLGRELDRGSHWVQALDRLVRLRNGLTHFKPEWVDEEDEHAKLSKKLEGYVSRSPWLNDVHVFPRAWATSATTSWAISSVLEFAAQFSHATALPDVFSKFRDRLNTTEAV